MVSRSAIVVCALIGIGTTSVAIAGDEAPFTQENLARGFAYSVQQGMAGSGGYGCGVAFVDLDSDGDPDIVALGSHSWQVGLFENDGTGHFTDRSDGSGIPEFEKSLGITAADYDADGDMDLHIACWGLNDALLRNEGDFQFTDVTEAAGIGNSPGAGAGCAWGDYDGDGWLDLYVANRTGTFQGLTPNHLFRNQGDGTFVDVAPELGVDDAWPTFQAAFFDSDRDGDADLYLSTDKAYSNPFNNRLFENVGGTFVEISEESGSGIAIESMGLAIGDLDHNGYFDIYCANTPPGNPLLMNMGGNSFVDQAKQWGVVSNSFCWGTHFFDYDNDGDLDLKICNTFDVPNRLYRQDENDLCVDVGEAMGVASDEMSFTMSVADIDNDGDLDMMVQHWQSHVDLFINNEGQNRNWIKYDVVGQGANLFGIGTVLDSAVGDGRQLREVAAGANYKSQNELIQHVGLDQATQVDELVVTWNGGTTRTLTGLPANNTWKIYPPERLGDVDDDGDRDLLDAASLLGCAAAGEFAPGCEVMDFDGDSDVDAADLDAFMDGYAWPVTDCDGNGVNDLIDILEGAKDGDGDGILDECELHPADFNGDGAVDGVDLGLLLAQWTNLTSPADLNGDGIVDGQDLGLLLAGW